MECHWRVGFERCEIVSSFSSTGLGKEWPRPQEGSVGLVGIFNLDENYEKIKHSCPIGSMGLAYLPTFGLLMFMVNVGKSTIHGSCGCR